MRFPIQREEDGSAVWGECARCGDELYVGQQGYRINGQTLCEDCMAEAARQWFRRFALCPEEEVRG